MRKADEELNIELDDAQEGNSLENDVPNLLVRGQTISRDGAIWVPEFPRQNGRASKRNIIKTRPGTKQFILARVDNSKDMFQELLDHKNVDYILEFTITKARRQGDSKFSFRKKELKAFFRHVLIAAF